MTGQSEIQQTNSPHIQYLLLREAPILHADAIQNALRRDLADEAIQVVVSEKSQSKSNSLVVNWKSMMFVIVAVDRPIPKDNFDVSMKISYGLKDGKAIIDDHKAHLIVSSLNAENRFGAMIFNAVANMSIANTLRSLFNPLGFYWVNSGILANSQSFEAAIASMTEALAKQSKHESGSGQLLPLTYWVGTKLYSPSQDKSLGAITSGLQSFLGFEIEIDPLVVQPSSIIEHTYGAIGYLFNHGPILKGGQEIGISGKDKFIISERDRNEIMPKRIAMTLQK